MKKLWLITLLLINYQNIKAQYTEIINSKRPGLSESPYGVGTDVLQIEGGVFYGKSKSDETFAKVDPFGATVFLRYGKFIEKLEVNANVTYQQNKLEFNNIFTSTTTISGVSQLTIGAKYMIFQKEFEDKSKEIRSWKKRTAFDKKRLIPSIGVYAGVNTNFLGEEYKDEKMSYKGAVLLQNDFSDRLVLITNLIADNITSDLSVYSYILTMTYALSNRWSIFGEHQGDFYKNSNNNFQLGAGVAYLFSRDFQIDAAIRSNFSTTESAFVGGIGASYRFDWHQDEEILVDENGNEMKPPKRDGFFKRIFKKKKK
ncbi:MAG: transporter [Urechidicola sp.]|nr:transporter [Urechidicola sp.]